MSAFGKGAADWEGKDNEKKGGGKKREREWRKKIARFAKKKNQKKSFLPPRLGLRPAPHDPLPPPRRLRRHGPLARQRRVQEAALVLRRLVPRPRPHPRRRRRQKRKQERWRPRDPGLAGPAPVRLQALEGRREGDTGAGHFLLLDDDAAIIRQSPLTARHTPAIGSMTSGHADLRPGALTSGRLTPAAGSPARTRPAC